MKMKLRNISKPSGSALLAWASVMLAAVTFVTLALSLVYFAQQSEERNKQLQDAADTNQELLRQVRGLVRAAREEGEQRRLDIRALARRQEELHDSDPSNSPFEARGTGERGDDEVSDAGAGGSEGSRGRVTHPRAAKTPNSTDRNPGKDPSGGNEERPRDRGEDEPPEDEALRVCAPVIGCLP